MSASRPAVSQPPRFGLGPESGHGLRLAGMVTLERGPIGTCVCVPVPCGHTGHQARCHPPPYHATGSDLTTPEVTATNIEATPLPLMANNRQTIADRRQKTHSAKPQSALRTSQTVNVDQHAQEHHSHTKLPYMPHRLVWFAWVRLVALVGCRWIFEG